MQQNIVERARREKTPLIDGQTVTFVWQGASAPRLFADFNGWEMGGGTTLQPIGVDLWAYSIDLPADTYIEYVFAEGKDRFPDPWNPHQKRNVMGQVYNYFAMPGAKLDGCIRPRRKVARGQVTSEVIQAGPMVIGEKRRVYFYQPAVDEPCPLLFVLDGQDYLRQAHLINIVDNLIAERRIRPIAMAMPEHGRKARMLEYSCAEMTLGFLAEFVLPLAQKRLNLFDLAQNPGSYGILGASMGGLMSLYAGLRMTGWIGKVLAQSGSYSVPGYDFVVWDLVRCGVPRELKIWMDCGSMESLVGCNRRMRDLLEGRKYDVTYHEYHGGHNYTCWRSDLVDGLIHLFPPIQQLPD